MQKVWLMPAMVKQTPLCTQVSSFQWYICVDKKKRVTKTLTSLWAALTERKFANYLVFIFCINLGEKCGKERISLYRDDVLVCFENTSGPEVESTRKAFIKLFKNEFNLNNADENTIASIKTTLPV